MATESQCRRVGRAWIRASGTSGWKLCLFYSLTEYPGQVKCFEMASLVKQGFVHHEVAMRIKEKNVRNWLVDWQWGRSQTQPRIPLGHQSPPIIWTPWFSSSPSHYLSPFLLSFLSSPMTYCRGSQHLLSSLLTIPSTGDKGHWWHIVWEEQAQCSVPGKEPFRTMALLPCPSKIHCQLVSQ